MWKGRSSPSRISLPPGHFNWILSEFYLFENTEDDKWLGWGRVFIQSLTIKRKKGLAPSDPAGPISFNAGDWVTSGTYVFIDIYDPDYQKIFTSHEAPEAWNYFGKG